MDNHSVLADVYGHADAESVKENSSGKQLVKTKDDHVPTEMYTSTVCQS